MISREKFDEITRKAALIEAENLLNDDKARTYTHDGRQYVLELERDSMSWDNESGIDILSVTTWGFDFEAILIPRNRQQLTAMRVTAQMAQHNPVQQVTLRYALAVQRRADEMAAKIR